MNIKGNIILGGVVMALFFCIPASAGELQCLNTFYSMITTELDRANHAQGQPKPDFDSLGKIKDIGLSHLEANVKNWPEGATFSISVLDEYVSIYVFCEGKQKHGEWRP